MAKKKDAQKESHWRKISRQQEGSDLSIRKFCDQQGISAASLYRWRRELKKRDQQSTSSGSETTGSTRPKANHRPTSAAPAADFIPIQLGQLQPALELIHPHGYQLRIPAGFDVASLQQTIEVLDAVKEA